MGGGASLMVPMKFSVVTERTVSARFSSLFFDCGFLLIFLKIHLGIASRIGLFYSRSKYWVSY